MTPKPSAFISAMDADAAAVAAPPAANARLTRRSIVARTRDWAPCGFGREAHADTAAAANAASSTSFVAVPPFIRVDPADRLGTEDRIDQHTFAASGAVEGGHHAVEIGTCGRRMVEPDARHVHARAAEESLAVVEGALERLGDVGGAEPARHADDHDARERRRGRGCVIAGERASDDAAEVARGGVAAVLDGLGRAEERGGSAGDDVVEEVRVGVAESREGLVGGARGEEAHAAAGAGADEKDARARGRVGGRRRGRRIETHADAIRHRLGEIGHRAEGSDMRQTAMRRVRLVQELAIARRERANHPSASAVGLEEVSVRRHALGERLRNEAGLGRHRVRLCRARARGRVCPLLKGREPRKTKVSSNEARCLQVWCGVQSHRNQLSSMCHRNNRRYFDLFP